MLPDGGVRAEVTRSLESPAGQISGVIRCGTFNGNAGFQGEAVCREFGFIAGSPRWLDVEESAGR